MINKNMRAIVCALTNTLFLAFFCVILISVTRVSAAPLRSHPVTYTQPDGTTLDCLVTGDEFFNYAHDMDGRLIIQNPSTGYFVYAHMVDGVPTPTNQIVGMLNARTPDNFARQQDISDQYINDHRKPPATPDGSITIGQPAEKSKISTFGVAPSSPSFNNIVIFIRFDGGDNFWKNEAYFDSMFNSGKESLRDYYQEISYNQLAIESYINQTVMVYTSPKSRDAYRPQTAQNPQGYPSSVNQHLLIIELCAQAFNSVKDSIPQSLNLDANGDKEIDSVTFIFQGDVGSWGEALWPTRYSFSGYYAQDFSHKGATVTGFIFSSETVPTVTYSHEMFHQLGAPDLYVYDSQYTTDPVGVWDIMSVGKGHPTAYLKYRYGGWIDSIPEITEDGQYSLSPLTSPTNNCFKIRSSPDSDEYFILEYRDKTIGSDKYLAKTGLLVYRINDNGSNSDYRASDPTSRMLLFVPRAVGADVNYAAFTEQDVYTGDSSPVRLNLSSGTFSGIYLTNFYQKDGKMHFDFGRTRPAERISEVSFLEKDLLLQVGEYAQTMVATKPTNPLDDRMTWRVSDPAVASVDAFGVVTALAEGVTTLTVETLDKGVSGHATIRVKDDLSTVQRFIADGTVADILPLTHSYAAVTNNRVLMLDRNFNLLWKTDVDLGEKDSQQSSVTDYTQSIAIVDTDIIVVGSSSNVGSGSWTGITSRGRRDAVVIRLTQQGEIVWKKNFGGAGDDAFNSVIPTPKGGFFAVGFSEAASFGNGDWDATFAMGAIDAIWVEFDSEGNVLSKRNFGGEDVQVFTSAYADSDGFVVAGAGVVDSKGDWTGHAGYGGYEGIILKFSWNNQAMWKKSFGGSGQDVFRKVALHDDMYVAVGYSEASSLGNGDWVGHASSSRNSEYFDGVLVAFERDDGRVLARRNWGGNGSDQITNLGSSPDGVMVVGNSQLNLWQENENGAWAGFSLDTSPSNGYFMTLFSKELEPIWKEFVPINDEVDVKGLVYIVGSEVSEYIVVGYCADSSLQTAPGDVGTGIAIRKKRLGDIVVGNIYNQLGVTNGVLNGHVGVSLMSYAHQTSDVLVNVATYDSQSRLVFVETIAVLPKFGSNYMSSSSAYVPLQENGECTAKIMFWSMDKPLDVLMEGITLNIPLTQ